jgi:hypothetical protein
MIAAIILLACSDLLGVVEASCTAARNIWLSAGGTAILAPSISGCCSGDARISCNAQLQITSMYS